MKFVLAEEQNPQNQVIFPINPESIKIHTATETSTWKVQDLGSVDFTTGRGDRTITFACVLPGGSRVHILPGTTNTAQESWIHDWRPPADLMYQLDLWTRKERGVPQPVLRFEVTGQSYLNQVGQAPTFDPAVVNMRVRLQSLDFTYQGAFGDYLFDVTLVEYRHVVVPLDGETLSPDQLGDNLLPVAIQTASPVPSSFTVLPGMTLIRLAQLLYGDSGRWNDIWQANLDMIGPNPFVDLTGHTLRMPGA